VIDSPERALVKPFLQMWTRFCTPTVDPDSVVLPSANVQITLPFGRGADSIRERGDSMTNTFHLAARGLAVTSLAVLFSGCSNAGSSPAAMQAGGSLGATQTTKTKLAAKSWMRPDAKNQKLLYISDRNLGIVNAYSYPKAQLVGQLTGFTQPQGLCSVATKPQTGSFWVVNTGASTIVEYAHGGTTPLATLSEPLQLPRSCSSDPTTGNLAVGNIVTKSDGPASVTIYGQNTTTGTNYGVAGMDSLYWLGYDGSGNLFASGTVPPYDEFLLAEMPAGTSAFVALNFPTFVANPGSVMWDDSGKGRLLVCDAQPNTSSRGPRGAPCYRIRVKGTTVTILSTTYLVTPVNTELVEQSTLAKKTIIAPLPSSNETNFYTYPTGGNPTMSIPGGSGGTPWGSTLSVQKN
jgi:hypothetical protein